jgi:hypothetical protein
MAWLQRGKVIIRASGQRYGAAYYVARSCARFARTCMQLAYLFVPDRQSGSYPFRPVRSPDSLQAAVDSRQGSTP